VKPESERAKRKGGLGEMNFCPLANTAPKARSGWEAAGHSASAERQSRKFFFLKRKLKKGRGTPKNEGKNFLLCSSQGDRRRWVGSAPVRAQIVAQRRFERRSAIATRRYFQSFLTRRKARSAPLARRASKQTARKIRNV
jgi:hypothetical protein